MTVATALAVSWNPLMNSKIQAAKRQTINKIVSDVSNPNIILVFKSKANLLALQGNVKELLRYYKRIFKLLSNRSSNIYFHF